MKKIIKKYNASKQRGLSSRSTQEGAVLLIAILMAGVALAVGVGVYTRTYKELLFGSFWKQTQIAFAAADAGLECALYWDLHPATSASCFGAPVSTWDPSANTSITLSDIPTSSGCVTIKIIKNTMWPFTTIDAQGHNDCNISNLRRVERGLSVSY